VDVEEEFRLVEGTEVDLALGDGGVRIAGRILAFFGAAVVFEPHVALTDRALAYLSEGTAAYLLVEHGERTRALRGVVTPAGEMLAFRLTDAFRLGQRRAWSRAAVLVAARLVPQGGGPPPTDTTTLDLSPTGARVARPGGMLVWPRYELTLSGAPLDAGIVVEAVPARVQPEELSLRFTSIVPADQRTLTAVVANHLGGRG
jgi:hypothetical protein